MFFDLWDGREGVRVYVSDNQPEKISAQFGIDHRRRISCRGGFRCRSRNVWSDGETAVITSGGGFWNCMDNSLFLYGSCGILDMGRTCNPRAPERSLGIWDRFARELLLAHFILQNAALLPFGCMAWFADPADGMVHIDILSAECGSR